MLSSRPVTSTCSVYLVFIYIDTLFEGLKRVISLRLAKTYFRNSLLIRVILAVNVDKNGDLYSDCHVPLRFSPLRKLSEILLPGIISMLEKSYCRVSVGVIRGFRIFSRLFYRLPVNIRIGSRASSPKNGVLANRGGVHMRTLGVLVGETSRTYSLRRDNWVSTSRLASSEFT
jgi:hypothetical protein